VPPCSGKDTTVLQPTTPKYSCNAGGSRLHSGTAVTLYETRTPTHFSTSNLRNVLTDSYVTFGTAKTIHRLQCMNGG